MSEKKDTFIQIRLPESLSERVALLADHFKSSPSALARVLLEAYCEAFEENHDHLPYPPRFAKFETLHDTIPAKPVLRVAEPREPWNPKKARPHDRKT